MALRCGSQYRVPARWRLLNRDMHAIVGAENLRHQAIFMNHAPYAVTPLNPELIQVCNAIG